jgi:hypothetical protein
VLKTSSAAHSTSIINLITTPSRELCINHFFVGDILVNPIRMKRKIVMKIVTENAALFIIKPAKIQINIYK